MHMYDVYMTLLYMEAFLFTFCTLHICVSRTIHAKLLYISQVFIAYLKCISLQVNV